MLIVRTVKGNTNPSSKVPSGEQAFSLHHPPLAMNPFGFYRVEPRTPLWQQTNNDPNAPATLFDSSVMLPDPAPDLFGGVPASVVPDEKQSLLGGHPELSATPLKEASRYGAHGAAIHEPKPRLLEFRHIEPVAGEGLRIGIVFESLFLKEAQRFSRLLPRVQRGSLEPAPPRLVLKADGPLWMSETEPDQPVACPFFLSYSGSGLSIHRFARCQRIPSLAKVARTVSALTRPSVRPSSKLTSAAKSKVHRLVGFPNCRGRSEEH